MSRKYYEEEMRYLHEAGKAFATAHPETARYLNLDSINDRDPYVERLFEGFAFLSGKVHERLDDDLPEYTEGMFNLLWPHYLRPIPALSVLEFKPKEGLLQESTSYPKGIEVLSKPVGAFNVGCRFRTTQTIDVHPFSLTDVSTEWKPGYTTVTLSFQLQKGVNFDKINFNNGKLRVYCNADPAIASTLHLFFTRYVNRVTIAATDDAKSGMVVGRQNWIHAVGYEEDEGLLPYSLYSFLGYRLLQEYFNYRPKFWFFDIDGFDNFKPDKEAQGFQVTVDFDRSYPEDRRFKTENLRLFCSPIVNLFPKDITPIRVDHLTTEYRTVPDSSSSQSYEIYELTEVVGIEEKTNRRHYYTPFFTFEREDKGRFYSSKVRKTPSDDYDTYISILGSNLDQDLATETLSISALCTNRSLPREHLKEGEINRAPSGFAEIVDFKNLNQPTIDRHPPRDQNFFWKLLSHLSSNYMSIATPHALKSLLELYDWERSDANKKRINGIRDVKWKPKEKVYKGAIIRGSEVVLEIQEGAFSDEGDLCLFGNVLSRFFQMYATINSFVYLTIILMPSGKTFEWQSLKGVKSPI